MCLLENGVKLCQIHSSFLLFVLLMDVSYSGPVQIIFVSFEVADVIPLVLVLFSSSALLNQRDGCVLTQVVSL